MTSSLLPDSLFYHLTDVRTRVQGVEESDRLRESLVALVGTVVHSSLNGDTEAAGVMGDNSISMFQYNNEKREMYYELDAHVPKEHTKTKFNLVEFKKAVDKKITTLAKALYDVDMSVTSKITVKIKVI